MSDLFTPEPDPGPDPAAATEPLQAGDLPNETIEAVPRPRKPRIRTGAIVWGLLVSAAAVFLLAIVTSPANAAAFNAWTGSLGWGGAILVAVIAVGAFILIMALLSVIRGGQRRRSTP